MIESAESYKDSEASVRATHLFLGPYLRVASHLQSVINTSVHLLIRLVCLPACQPGGLR